MNILSVESSCDETAALRHGVKTVIIPAANEKDLAEIDQTVRNSLQFITAHHVDSVLAAALDPVEAHKESVSAQPQSSGTSKVVNWHLGHL